MTLSMLRPHTKTQKRKPDARALKGCPRLRPRDKDLVDALQPECHCILCWLCCAPLRPNALVTTTSSSSMLRPLIFALGIVFTAAPATLARAELNPNGTGNLFVYYAQSSGRNARLDQLCLHPKIDAVILGFIRDFSGTASYPTVDFGPWICPAKRSANSTVAPGLASCPELGRQVQACQAGGKKIFVSIGGATSNTSFDGDGGGQDADLAARKLWLLFGEDSTAPELRPLGNVTVDGFDIGESSAESSLASCSRLQTTKLALRRTMIPLPRPCARC